MNVQEKQKPESFLFQQGIPGTDGLPGELGKVGSPVSAHVLSSMQKPALNISEHPENDEDLVFHRGSEERGAQWVFLVLSGRG